MTFEYQLTKQDYIDFNIFHLTFSKSIRRSIFFQRYIFSIVFLVLPFLLTQVTTMPLWYWFTVFMITYIIWIAFYPKHIKRTVVRRISKMLDEGKNKGLLGKHTFSFAEDGIVDITEESESKTKLSAIENIVESKEHIFIYIGAVAAFIIPLRIFKDEIQKVNFLKDLREMAAKSKLQDKY